MKSVLVSKENNKVKFNMEFTAEEFESAVVKVYQKNKAQFRIDGFRKGKAPRSIIEKMYGEGIFWDDAINNLVGENYGSAVDELELEVIDYPAMTDMSEIKKGEGFTATIEVEVYPEVEIKDYKGVEIEKVESEVTEADIDHEMEMLQKRNARMIAVDREVKDGDTVILDYEGSVDGVNFDGGSAERYPLKIGSGSFIPGFEDQLIGQKANEEIEVKVTFPEDYHAEELAAKEAIFKCMIHEIKEEEIPEIDDEFVKDVSEFDTVEELRASKKEELAKEKAADADAQMRNDALAKIYEANDIEIPEAMIKTEMDQILDEFAQQLASQGLSIDQYFEYLGKDAESFKEEVKPDAEKRVKTRMIVQAIADQENIEVTEEDVEAELNRMAETYGMDLEQIKGIVDDNTKKYLEKDIRSTKAVDFVIANAVIK